MDGLIVKPKWGMMEVKGIKTVEIRGHNTTKRGRIYILGSGTKRVLGEVTLCDSFPLDEDTWEMLKGKHCVHISWDELRQRYKTPYAWVLKDPEPYKKRILYEHPQGAVIWINDVSTEEECCEWINAYPEIEPNPMFMYGICSGCGFEQSVSAYLNYCPNCGSKMKIKKVEE